MTLRPYQQRALDALFNWWTAHPGAAQIPVCCMPTGSGKSVVIAELCRVLFQRHPELHPRTVVLVPSKELAEQNAAKLRAMLPPHLSVGYYSASLNQRRASADVIVATIGSIYKAAHLLGNIQCVVIDECHLVNPDGAEAGRYRQFLTDLAQRCIFRAVGYTATPFRGNGVWLTDGDDALFTGVACTVRAQELLQSGHLAPLIRPMDAMHTRIDTSGVKTTSGDYNLRELADRVDAHLQQAAQESVQLAAQRKKWLAFCATVANAQTLVTLLTGHGITAALVCGETPAAEREALIASFRAGHIRCLVTVLALATGFDVPDVDCLVWLRPTQSPVLYVQGAGRGMRPANGKTDCLWLDFSDTTERLGPVDTIRGHRRSAKPAQLAGAPYKVCDQCGERAHPSDAVCPSCGAAFAGFEPEARSASNAAILSWQIAAKVRTYPVTDVTYSTHASPGRPDALRVDYYSGVPRVCSEFVCLEHGGFAGEKALHWWRLRRVFSPGVLVIDDMHNKRSLVKNAVEALHEKPSMLRQPAAITVNEHGRFPEIVRFHWPDEPANP